MKIKTEFKIGDTVFIVDDTDIEKIVINDIRTHTDMDNITCVLYNNLYTSIEVYKTKDEAFFGYLHFIAQGQTKKSIALLREHLLFKVSGVSKKRKNIKKGKL